jgi:UDP-4-amino-4,6-dideoxy-N-acetyl-beta-L-altrosamine N-acetyltransferase
MLTQHLITLDEHRQWFERTSTHSQRKVMVVEHQGQPFGLVHFTGVQAQAAVEWGFYVAPDASKGSGQRLGSCALAFAFEQLQVHKVCGQVLASNAASIRFHERLGFSPEGRLREQVFIEPHHHDLLCFGLLHSEWLQTPEHQG